MGERTTYESLAGMLASMFAKVRNTSNSIVYGPIRASKLGKSNRRLCDAIQALKNRDG